MMGLDSQDCSLIRSEGKETRDMLKQLQSSIEDTNAILRSILKELRRINEDT